MMGGELLRGELMGGDLMGGALLRKVGKVDTWRG